MANEKLHDRFDEEVGMKVKFPQKVLDMWAKEEKEKEVQKSLDVILNDFEKEVDEKLK